MDLYDTHAHLDYPDFQNDIEDVLRRASLSGIARIITVGTNLESSRRAVQLSEKHPNIFAAIGWHPSFAEQAPENIYDELLKLAQHPKVVAIGETGLDFYRLPSKQNPEMKEADTKIIEKQRTIFVQQLEVATKSGLNVIIHQRESADETFRLLESYKGKIKPVFHCFTDSEATLNRVLEFGGFVSFTGIVTFKNAETVRHIVKQTPLSKIMIETDSPFLAPAPHRGKRCEPSFAAITAATVAKIKGCSTNELAEATSKTAKDFFKFDKSC